MCLLKLLSKLFETESEGSEGGDKIPPGDCGVDKIPF